MGFQPGVMIYTQGFGSSPENLQVPHYDVRAPTSSDINYPVGKWWLWVGNSLYYLLSQSSGVTGTTSNWVEVVNSSGDVLSVVGTANQITVTTSSGTATISLPSAITTPGSLTTTTSLTATLGAITATNGNLVLGTAGNKLVSTSVASTTTAGANSFGTVALVAGTATVSTTAVTASSIIMLTRLVASGTSGTGAIGMLSVGTITAGSSFVINALTTSDLATVVTNDISTIGWMIIN